MIQSFTSFSAAAQEVGHSRIYAGIHWPWDVQNGLTLGNQVGDYVASHFLLPVSKSHGGGADAITVSGTSGTGRLGVGVLDSTWWTTTIEATDLALADLVAHPQHRR